MKLDQEIMQSADAMKDEMIARRRERASKSSAMPSPVPPLPVQALRRQRQFALS